jgi:glycosyltransferase involved in cell wall biosynthesis
MRVSILIPCYNAERWVAQAIESALAQSWPDKEVIVVDDGSTDASLAIVGGFGPRVRWESGPNRGGNRARNRLLELSTGEWLQYLDADDYLFPDKVERQVRFVEQHADVDVVYSPSTMEYWSPEGSKQDVLGIPPPHDPWVLLARWYMPQTGASLWRASSLRQVGGWKPDQPCCQEHELYLRMLMAGKKFDYCAHSGSVYRQWSEQTVCKRDKPETRRRRLEIEAAAEAFLQQSGALTPERLWAINQARFETARWAWQDDPEEAIAIDTVIRRSQPRFRPSGPAAPRRYRIVYELLGFRAAETLAAFTRNMALGRGS